MDFWQAVSMFSLVFGLISSLVAVVGFFVDVSKLKHKHKILLVSIPLALIFIGGGTVSFAYHAAAAGNANTDIATSKTTPTTVSAPGSVLQPATTVTVSPTSSPAATTTPTSTASTSLSPKSPMLPLAIPCIGGNCSSYPFTLTLNSISVSNGETDWVFMLANDSGSSCSSVGFSPAPTLGSWQAQGQTTGWAMSQGQQLPVTMIFPQPQKGVPYDLNVRLAFQKCASSSGTHGSGGDSFQTEAFVF